MDTIPSEEAYIEYYKRVLNITKTARNIMKEEKPSDFPDWLKNDLMDDSKMDEVSQ
jgi:hypothetical protein